jgi:RNA polymerase sigma-70 factor, ECF subfamily
MALLMGQALDGEAFAELCGRTYRALYAYAAAVILDEAAAEDVTQRAFELAYARRWSFHPERGSAEAWLFGIARHVALDERRCQRRRPVPVPEEVSSGRGEPDRELERADQRGALFAAVGTLDRLERELIALKFWSDCSNREIAAVVGCSESKVGTRLHRSMAKLREVCDDIA